MKVGRNTVVEVDSETLMVDESPFLDVEVIDAILAHRARVYQVDGLQTHTQFILLKGGRDVQSV